MGVRIRVTHIYLEFGVIVARSFPVLTVDLCADWRSEFYFAYSRTSKV